ncbi:MAG: tRNA (adenosine(37)-N6)-dimethylallyltransferase MiaA [bacterium]|nr:tRNA (adenosine(37)-N6)-dimethylallyltransferase MiaA [bacterium]
MEDRPLIVIVGETASGKTGLAIEIAEKFNGEIVCADSQTIRRGMDIGTAKPTAIEQAEARHHLLDVVDPYENFSVADFKKLALKAISDIESRGKLPILVGGSGMYIDSVIFDYEFREPGDPTKREELEAMTVEELQQIITDNSWPMPKNEQNPRHLVRVIEAEGKLPKPKKMRDNTLVLGLTLDPEKREVKISKRVDGMFKQDLLSEVKVIINKYGPPPKTFDAIGYRAVMGNLNKKSVLDLEAAKAEFITGDKQLAKKQRTWFKRNKSIHWLKNRGEAQALVSEFLNKP